MPDTSLAGKKVAIVVESQFIPEEIETYQRRFASYGATVDLVSRLFRQSHGRFYGTVEPRDGDAPTKPYVLKWIDVTLDIEDEVSVKPENYAAIIVAANYVSVRLRWSDPEHFGATDAAAAARSAPAPRFLRKAMDNPRIIKGMPCHAVWLLTPFPEVLRGRKVTCNKVVLADVLNAGAIYTPYPPGTPRERQVVVDRDLVTNTGWHASDELVDRIRGLILELPQTDSA